MDKKIIISGNSGYGLAKSLKKIFPHADFYSRSCSDSDLARYEVREDFAKTSLDYDVYISCSCLSQFRQTLLLEKVYHQWIDNEKKGQIICLGSTADALTKATRWVYPIEKKALRAYCRNLSLDALGGNGHAPSGIRMTYVSPGHINTPRANEKHPGVDKIDPDYLASVIQWLLEQPKEVNISEFCLDPIQNNYL